MLGSWKKKKEGNLKDSILEAYVLESLQPAPCQENIGQVGWSNLMQPQMVYASQFGALLWEQRETKAIVLCGVVILPPSVTHGNKQITSLKADAVLKE